MEGSDGNAYERFEQSESSFFNFLQLENCAFVKIARWGAVLTAVTIMTLPLFTSIIYSFPADFVALYIVGGLLSAVELPFCCSFSGVCRRVQGCLAPVEVYWLRGAFYLLLSSVLIVVNVLVTKRLDLWLALSTCALLVVGILYILAFCNGERSSREWEQERENRSESDERSGSMAWIRNIIPGGNKDESSDLQRAALRAAMSTAI